MEDRRKDTKETLAKLEENQKEIMEAIKKIEETILKPSEVEYVKLAIINEAKKIAFKDAVIEKTLVALLWSGLTGLGWALWETFKHFLK